MAYLFYRRECSQDRNADRSIDSGYSYSLWKPTLTCVVPLGLPVLPFGVWWLMHYWRLFANRDYSLFLVYKEGALVHHTCVFPGYFRFPFMAADDLQIGDTWTVAEHRGKGIATFAIREILEAQGRPGRRFWYITDETNSASIRAVEKVGFLRVGKGGRSSRFGLRLLGSFVPDG